MQITIGIKWHLVVVIGHLSKPNVFVIITVRNEVAKVMSLQVCVCPQGGCLVRGVSGPGGMPDPEGVGIPACIEADPPWERRLLLRTVRILLECILVIVKCGQISYIS